MYFRNIVYCILKKIASKIIKFCSTQYSLHKKIWDVSDLKKLTMYFASDFSLQYAYKILVKWHMAH
jgi:hypothetical protein